MNISLISAMGRNHVIGLNGEMPWHLPADLKHFKATTLGKPIIMGRKTFDSIGQRPLPQRHNIILTHQADFQASDCTVVTSVEAALAAAGQVEEVMVIGGETVYRLFLPHANRIYLTVIDQIFEGDTFFPEFDNHWKTVKEDAYLADEKNSYNYKFILLERQEK